MKEKGNREAGTGAKQREAGTEQSNKRTLKM